MKKLFALLLMVGLSAGAYAQNSKTTNTPAPEKKSVLKFEEYSHDFGEVAYGSDVSWSFKFKNTSKEPVAISNVGTSCGCTTPGWTKEPVAPGKTGVVTAKYDSSRIGAFTKTLTVYVKDETIVLTIHGTIKEPSNNNNTQGK
jgi:hypothetical protein